MTAWKRGVARGAWTAFLGLFAAWTVAGTSLCGLHGARESQPGGSSADAVHVQAQAPHGVAAGKLESTSPTAQSPHDGDDQVCEELVYLTSELASPSTIERSLTVDWIPWSQAPASDWKVAVVAVSVSPPQLAHPPPSRSPLDISPRLRI